MELAVLAGLVVFGLLLLRFESARPEYHGPQRTDEP